MRTKHNPVKFVAALGAACVFGWATASHAALLVQVTGAANVSEFEWEDPAGPNPLGLYIGPGSTGNGDGHLHENEASPGLKLAQIPFNLSSHPGGKLEVDATTTFFDVSLVLNGLTSAGDAIATVVTPITILSQPLASGATFELWSTDPPGADPAVLLLAGTLNSAAIVGIEGATTAALQSNNVSYTGGKIYDQLVLQGGTTTGQMSISLLLRNNDTVVRSGGQSGPLAPFSADASGLFNTPVIPEPASMGLLLLTAATALGRRFRRV